MRHLKLFTPGPTEVRKEILQTMATPQIHHRSNEFKKLYEEIQEKLKKVLYTENPVLLFPSSSTGAMEAAVVNGVERKCLNLVNGAFSKRWHEITRMNGIECDALSVEWNIAIKPEMVEEKLETGEYDAVTLVFNETSTGLMNPLEEIAKIVRKYDVLFFVDAVSAMGGVKIEVDKLGIDMCLAGVQKCFALPSGITVASVSQRLLERANKVPPRCYYFSLPLMYKYHLKNQTRVTPPISQMFALNAQLDYILKEEGLENRFRRHEMLAKIVQDWARKYFDVYPEKGYESKTLTCVKNTRNISVKALIDELSKYYMRISNGYGELKEKTFRIAHMGDVQLQDIKGLLAVIEEILNL